MSHRRWPVHLADAPLLGIVPEGRLAAGRIDVDAMRDVAPHGVEEPVGVSFAVEVASLLRAARVLPPAGPVSHVRPLVDARHDASPPRSADPASVLKRSSGPQSVLRI